MKKILALLLALLLVGSLFVGCGTDNGSASTAPSTAPSTASSSPPSEAPVEENDSPFIDGTLAYKTPLVDEKTTFSAWSPMATQLAAVLSDMNDVAGYIVIEKQTNIHITWETPSVGQESVSWNLLLSSGDMPDLLQNASGQYTAGVDKAIADEICIELTYVIDNFMPNYATIIASESYFATDTKTDAGSIGYIYCIYDEAQTPWMGLNVRQDWMDDLGLPEPLTYDDWYTMLTAFKTQKGADSPLMLTNVGDTWFGHYIGGFGVINGLSQVDGKVVFGPVEPGFRSYLETFSKWYAEGLIDKDFNTRTDSPFLPDTSYIYTGRAGAWAGFANGATPVTTGQATDPNLYVQGVHSPVVNSADGFSNFRTRSSRQGVGSMISTDCENVELLARWIDYCYSEEGSLLLNFGEEGVHWFVDTDGAPTMDGPGMEEYFGLPYSQIQQLTGPVEAPYLRLMYKGSPVKRSTESITDDKQMAPTRWTADSEDYMIPAAISLTEAESNTRTNILQDINTLVSENMIGVITGAKTLADWDAVVAQIRSMNIDEAISVTQTALDRYYAR